MAKGQMFLIIGIVIVLTLALLKTSLSLVNIIEEKRNLELSLDDQKFANVRNEALKAISIGYNESANMTWNAVDFLRFARTSFKANAIDLEGLIVLSHFTNATPNADTALNVTVLNLLGAEINNLTLAFESSSRTFTSVSDNSEANTDFTFNTESNINSTLSVYYLTDYENSTESITIPIEMGKSKFIGFLDLRLVTSGQEQRDKTTQTYIL